MLRCQMHLNLVLIVHFFATHWLSTPLLTPKDGKYKLMGWWTALSKQHILSIKSKCQRHSKHYFNAIGPREMSPGKGGGGQGKSDVQPDVISKAWWAINMKWDVCTFKSSLTCPVQRAQHACTSQPHVIITFVAMQTQTSWGTEHHWLFFFFYLRDSYSAIWKYTQNCLGTRVRQLLM